MSRNAEIELTWGDGTYKFRLAIGQIRELQEKTDCGPMELIRRLSRGIWRLDDVRETIRLGLVGGGQVDPIKALSLVARYVDERPLYESVPTAQAVLMVLVFGNPEDNPLGEAPAAGETSSPTGGSPSPRSTEPEQ